MDPILAPARCSTTCSTTSASTGRGFAGSAEGADLTGVKAVCIGRQTEAAAKELGMRTWTAEKATLESLTKRLIEAAAECRGDKTGK